MREAPFREFCDASPDAVVVVDRTGCINFANVRVEAMLGYLPNELLGESLSVLVPERYRDVHRTHFERFTKDPTPRMMGAGLELTALRKDGTELQIEISLTPYRAPDGPIVIAAMRDITKRPKETEFVSNNSNNQDLLRQARNDVARLLAQAGLDTIEHETATRLQRLLLEEVHHRMKNLLAMVMAITSQSLQSAESLDQGREAIATRLVAMGKAQDLLLQSNEAGVQLADVIHATIEPFDSIGVRRFFLSDTPIEIAAGTVLPFTLSINELCTNAVKYGALSNTTGSVAVTLTVDENTQLFTLRWTENGGPSVHAPIRKSFGTRLLVSLAAQLHGTVQLGYEPAGLVYQLVIPLALLKNVPRQLRQGSDGS